MGGVMSEVVFVREGLIIGAGVILSALQQEAYMKVRTREVQVNLVKKEPLGPGDPCLKCSYLGSGCEEPCEKVLSFIKIDSNPGDKFQTI